MTLTRTIQVRWGESEGLFKGFAHVTFSLLQSTEKAVAMSGEATLAGRRIKIDYARDNKKGGKGEHGKQVAKPPGCTTVWVGNLAPGVTKDLLTHEMKACGVVKEAKLIYDRRTGPLKAKT